jgi:hypothetical protein
MAAAGFSIRIDLAIGLQSSVKGNLIDRLYFSSGSFAWSIVPSRVALTEEDTAEETFTAVESQAAASASHRFYSPEILVRRDKVPG